MGTFITYCFILEVSLPVSSLLPDKLLSYWDNLRPTVDGHVNVKLFADSH